MTDAEWKVGILRRQGEMKSDLDRIRADLESVIRDHRNLQAELRGIPSSVRRTMWSSAGVVVVVVMAIFGYLVADLQSHEELEAHPEAKASMAAVDARVDGIEKAQDRVVRLVEKNYDLLIQMQSQPNGREN